MNPFNIDPYAICIKFTSREELFDTNKILIFFLIIREW